MTRKRKPANPELAPLPLEAVPLALLNSKQAAAFLGTTEATLADWRCDRIGPPFLKLGVLVRYQLRSLQGWINSRMIYPSAG